MAKEVFMVRAESISFSVKNRLLLAETTVAFEPARFHVIMGANGAGKSTLLKILSGNQKANTGNVFLGATKLAAFTKTLLAQRRAVLSQHYSIAFPVLVKDFVLMGRYPYYRNNPSRNDLAICNEAMQWMQVEALKDRDYNTLSGGEAQKVQMSRVLAQVWPNEKEEPKVLFLDEPVSHLDLRYQHQLLHVAKELCQKSVTVIAVLHDMNLALSFADRLLLMKSGAVLYDIHDPAGITALNIQHTFDVKAQVLKLANKKRPIVVF